MSDAPEDWPARVTDPALPPKEAMFFWMKPEMRRQGGISFCY